MELKNTTAYIDKLGLSDLFNEGCNKGILITDTFLHKCGKHVTGEIKIFYDEREKMMLVAVSCSSMMEWSYISGNLSKRRLAILQYFADNGFRPATALLREYKIELLTKWYDEKQLS